VKAKIAKTLIKTLEAKEKPYEVSDTQISGFILRVQPTGRKTFYFAYRNKAGTKQRVKIGVLGPMTLEQARDRAKLFDAKIAGGVDIGKEKAQERHDAKQAKETTLAYFIEHRFTSWVLANQKEGQAALDRLDFSFKEFKNKPLHELNISLIDTWRTKQREAGLKPSTINRRVNSLKGLLRQAVAWEMLESHPLLGLKDLKVDNSPKVRYLEEGESSRLFQALEVRDEELKQARERGNEHRQKRGYELLPSLLNYAYADRMTPLILLSIKTGMRRGELFDLLWEDVSFDQEMITVKGDTTKTSKTRYIPLGPKALEALKQWGEQQTKKHSRVFPADDEGGRLDNVRKSWASILKRADIASFRWHDMRHDFASQLVMKGVSLNTVRELCGHANYETTLRYAHLAPSHKAEAVALLG